jgi:hypothetical protein
MLLAQLSQVSVSTSLSGGCRPHCLAMTTLRFIQLHLQLGNLRALKLGAVLTYSLKQHHQNFRYSDQNSLIGILLSIAFLHSQYVSAQQGVRAWQPAYLRSCRRCGGGRHCAVTRQPFSLPPLPACTLCY